jgi:hypothetical protein
MSVRACVVVGFVIKILKREKNQNKKEPAGLLKIKKNKKKRKN